MLSTTDPIPRKLTILFDLDGVALAHTPKVPNSKNRYYLQADAPNDDLLPKGWRSYKKKRKID